MKKSELTLSQIEELAESSYKQSMDLCEFIRPDIQDDYLATNKENYIAGFEEGFSYGCQFCKFNK